MSVCETVAIVKSCLRKIGLVEADVNSLNKCEVSSHGCKFHKYQIIDSLLIQTRNPPPHETNFGCHNEKEVIMEPCGHKPAGSSPALHLAKGKSKRNKRSLSPFALRSTDRKSLHRKEKLRKSPGVKPGPFHSKKRTLPLDTKSHNVFGSDLDHLPLFSAQLSDGRMVYVPEFLIDASKIITENVSIEGIFRKAGSAHRQTELKRLLNVGKDLPPTVHPIDAACLLKQFLSSLSTPLIPMNIFSLMVRCLDLTEESQLDALVLCSLLLPSKHQDTLCYILHVLAKVASHHQRNFMDPHNLSIVMAPNILPQILYKGKRHERMQNVDIKLSSAILIIKILIEGASKVCRLPKDFEQFIASQRETPCPTCQQEILCNTEQTVKYKKRRSGPINKIVSGLRRVVQGDIALSSSSSTEDIRVVSNDAVLPSCQLPQKDANFSSGNVNKENRKKCHPTTCDSDQHPNKRLRIERASPREDTPIPIRLPLLPSQPKKSSSLFSLKESRRSPFKSSHTPIIRKPFANFNTKEEESAPLAPESNWPCSTKRSASPTTPLTAPPSPSHLSAPHKPRRRSCKASIHYQSPAEKFSTPYTQMGKFDGFKKSSYPNQSSDIPTSCTPTQAKKAFTDVDLDRAEIAPLSSAPCYPSNSREDALPKVTLEKLPAPNHLGVPGKPRRRSCEPSLQYENKTPQATCSSHHQKRRSDNFRKFSCPDGSTDSILGPRGVPDGAESSIRDSSPHKVSPPTSIKDIEEHYCEVKLAVKHMEEQVDRDNLQQMSRTLFPAGETSHMKSISFSEMVSKAYESVKLETKDLDTNPSENMSRRLDKELKIRGRRSDEYKVSRSPSERKIGIVRRRSKEMKGKGVPCNDSPTTPKLKSPLLQTPRFIRLKPGTPHSSRLDAGSLKLPMLGIPVLSSGTPKNASNLNASHHNTAPLTRQRSALLGQKPLMAFDLTTEHSNKPAPTPQTSRRPATSKSQNLEEQVSTNLEHSVVKVKTNVNSKGFNPKNSDWTPAPNYMENLDEYSNPSWLLPETGLNGQRSSIAALRRQKKVSANVELFNKMKSTPRDSAFPFRKKP